MKAPRLGPLAARLALAFPTASRDRGAEYVREKRVQLRAASDERVEAWVRGTAMYRATLVAREREIGVHCSCPHFDDRGVHCKHLWALVTAADAAGLLADVAARDRVAIVDLDAEEVAPPPPPPRPRRKKEPEPVAPVKPAPPAWRALAQLPPDDEATSLAPLRREHRRESRCVVRVRASGEAAALVVSFELRTITPRGLARDWRPVSIREAAAHALPEEARAFAMLDGCPTVSRTYGEPASVAVPFALATSVCALLARGRRAEVEGWNGQRAPLVADGGAPFRFVIEAREEDGGGLALRGALVRGAGPDAERADFPGAWLITSEGVLVLPARVAALEPIRDFAWVHALRAHGAIRVPPEERDAFVAYAAERGDVELPASLRFDEVRARPRFVARFARPDREQARVVVRGSAAYGDREVPLGSAGRAVRCADGVHVRDRAAERDAIAQLAEVGVRFAVEGDGLDLPIARLAAATRALLDAGWRVEGADRRYRGATSTRAAVESGIDWFDVRAEVDFDGERVPLPRLLEAARRGESFVELGDGSLGVLPDEWLARWGALADLGRTKGEAIRFARSQAPVVDALVSATAEAAPDPPFAELRARLAAGFRAPREPTIAPGFRGTLRDYQREGVAWMEALGDAGFGGCLADDMGLGKTVQVLARLAARAEAKAGPSLVVAPRSLVFNWRDEAARFAPSLRVVEHAGSAREASAKRFAEADLVVTTYGTLRRDAEALAAIEFDHVVLDEAQAIKNASTASATIARSLRARHRLALTGTPIENHLGELWSLFDFLNPGMLGRSSAFKRWSAARELDPDDRALLARALRPFLLRRTKAAVARELPERVEQTIACELEPEQRALYDELRRHYRRSLLARAKRSGEANALNVLEALLRLRQAACHPGLVDPARREAPSAKLDALFAQLASVLEEGQKAIVFSQFTSLLALVRARLWDLGVQFEELDGGTRNRAARVARFQEDDDCKVFLVSLKAGGTGLNLTAATYVFLLDPWWNPAAEAQAIDRAHRIGQTRTVFAYRVVAKDTIEERVLELQATKRELAEGILAPGGFSVMRELTVEDLDRLLS